jgi:hypothetical protein
MPHLRVSDLLGKDDLVASALAATRYVKAEGQTPNFSDSERVVESVEYLEVIRHDDHAAVAIMNVERSVCRGRHKYVLAV